MIRNTNDLIAELRRRGHDVGEGVIDAGGKLSVIVDDEPRSVAELTELLRAPEAFFLGVEGAIPEPLPPGDEFLVLSTALERLSPLVIDGVSHAVWLIDVRESKRPDVFDIVVGVNGPNGTQQGTLHVDRDRLHRCDFSATIVSVIAEIVQGRLPPGMRELL